MAKYKFSMEIESDSRFNISTIMRYVADKIEDSGVYCGGYDRADGDYSFEIHEDEEDDDEQEDEK